MRVLVRAFGGEPLIRVVVAVDVGVKYVVSEESAPGFQAGTKGAIGFPADAVFRADDGLYARMLDAASPSALQTLWQEAERADNAPLP